MRLFTVLGIVRDFDTGMVRMNIGTWLSQNDVAHDLVELQDAFYSIRDELAASVAYALGIVDVAPEEAAAVLDVEDPIALWHGAVRSLERRMDNALVLWREVVAAMPPIRNVALRDTLASLGELKRRYDVYFAAHEVPCDIDYQLSSPVDSSLVGLDYIEAYLAQLLVETRWIAQFDVDSCISVLERICPDYRGLHVNLYDLLLPHQGKLVSANPR